jgi:hypothetical protein
VGAKLASALTKDSVQQLLGGCLFVVSPVLFARLGHDTLCAHWVLLGLLYLGLRDYQDDRAHGAHPGSPWAAVMVAAGIPSVSCRDGVGSRRRRSSFVVALEGLTIAGTALWMIVVTGGLFGVWASVGYFGDAPNGSGGFGLYRPIC